VHFFLSIACLPLLLFLPESHGPTILLRRAKKLRKNGHDNVRAAHELHGKTLKELILDHISRPFRMLISEPIMQGAGIWMALAYSLF
jgi:hypothetical protein